MPHKVLDNNFFVRCRTVVVWFLLCTLPLVATTPLHTTEYNNSQSHSLSFTFSATTNLRANTTPTIILNDANLDYTENESATQIDAAATVSDVDGDGDWDGGTITLQITANYEADDELSIPSNIVGAINVVGISIRDGATEFGILSYTPPVGGLGPTFTATLNSNATNSRVQQLVQSISYHSNSENPGIGNRVVTVSVTDKNSATSSDTRTITVTRTNDAPTILSAIPDTTVVENFPDSIYNRDLDTVFNDVDGDNLSFSVYSQQALVTPWIDSPENLLFFTSKSNANGIDTLYVVAKDATDSIVDTVIVTITPTNKAPTVTAPMADTTISEDFSPINFRDLNTVFSDEESGSTLDFSALSLQNNIDLIIKDSDSVLVFVAKKDVNGIDTVVVTASDGELSVKDSIIVTISAVEDAPKIVVPIPDTTVLEDFLTPITYRDLNAVFTDADGDALTFSVFSVGGSITPTINSADSVLTFASVANANGVDTLIITAKDALDSIRDTVYVTVSAVNDAPSLSSVTAQTIPEDSLLTITVAMTDAADVDDDILSVILGGGANYTIVKDTVKVANNFIGTLTVPVAVTDGIDTTSSIPMTITVPAKNDTPEIVNPIPDTLIFEDFLTFEYRDLKDVFYDEESGTNLTFTVTSLQDLLTPILNSGDSILSLASVADINGSDTILVTASDGELVVTDTVLITIAPMNDGPQMSSVTPQVIQEDELLTVLLSMTDATDIDNTLSNSSVVVHPGNNYTVTDRTIIPTANWSGTLTVPISVTDGTWSTMMFDMIVTVNPVNDAPILTSTTAQSIDEDGSLTILLAMTDATDVDNTLSDESLIIEGSGGYTVSGRTIIPNPDFYGTLSVPIKVTDGALLSAMVNMVVEVNPVNDAPILTSVTPQTTAEDVPLTLKLSMTDAVDIDHSLSDANLIVEPGSNYSVSGLTITPDPDWNGTLTVPVKVSDGIDTTDAVPMTVTVTAVNDIPILSGIATQVIDEDASCTVALSMIQVTDIDNTLTDESIIVEPGNLYTLNGRTISPLANFYGTLTVPIRITDGIAISEAVNMSITVLPVNDVPTLTTVAPQVIPEDTPLKVLLSQTDANDIDDILTNFSVVVDSGTNYTVDGSTITPIANFNGVLTVPVRIFDGTATSDAVPMTVTVTAVNDTPTITTVTTQTIAEETSLTVELSMSDAADVDNTLTDASLIVASGENYTVSGMTITPVVNFNGILSVPITVTDGIETSETVPMEVIVTPVNDAPTVTTAIAQSTAEDTPLLLTAAMTDAADVDGDLLIPVIDAGENYTVSGATIIPAPNFHGTLHLPVRITDGTVTTSAVPMTLTVTPVNDAPTLLSVTAQTIVSDSTLTVTLDMVEGESDVEGSALSIVLGDGENYTVSGAAIIPALQFVGTLMVPLMVSDGELTSEPLIMTVTVIPRNIPPVLEVVAPFAMQQDLPKTLSMNDVIASDADGDELSLIIQSGENYTVSGTTIIPAVGFLGTLTVPFCVTDGRDHSNTITISVTVKAIHSNTTPVVAGAAFTVEKNRSLMLTTSSVQATDADGDGLTLLITSGANYTVNRATVTPDSGYVGILSVPLRATDGIDTSLSVPITITVFEKKIGFHIGQVLVSDTFTVTVAPNPVTVNDRELFIGAPKEEFDQLRVAIYNHTSDLMVRGPAELKHGKFLFRWEFARHQPVLRGYSYVALLTFIKDGVVVKEEKKMIGITR